LVQGGDLGAGEIRLGRLATTYTLYHVLPILPVAGFPSIARLRSASRRFVVYGKEIRKVVVIDRVDERLDALIANSPIASVISDPRQKDNPIIACNAAFIELTGYYHDEIIGRNCKFLAGPATEPWLTEAIRNGVQRHSPVIVEILNYKRDGTPFRNAVLVAPMFDEFFLGSQVELEPDAPTTNANRRMAAAMAVKALSRRQREVLVEMALGHLNKQIAHTLGLSEQTVKMHRALLMTRLGATTTADAIRIAVEAGL
jgi:PAS domain S-box-containing protein